MIQNSYTATMDRLPGGLLITDKESRVLYASAALERRTGYAVAEIVGKKPGELWGGKMRRKFYTTLWKTIETDGRSFVGEVNNTRKDGAKKDEHIFIVPIHDATGRTRYFAEIHPECLGENEERAFGYEFLNRTAGMVQDETFFKWMFQRLSVRADGTAVDWSGLGQEKVVSDPASFLYQAFIAPTEATYSRRRDDALLIAQAQANPKHFALLYEKYFTATKEYFLKRLGGESTLADDLTQETFIRAFRYLPAFRMANASYYTYLLRVAHSILVNHFRDERLSTVALTGNEAEVATVEVPYQHDLESLLTVLNPVERTVMLSKYRHGEKVRAIAKRLGKSENAVKLILSRSRKKLKRSL